MKTCKYCNGTKKQICHRCKGDRVIVSKNTLKFIGYLGEGKLLYRNTTTPCFICSGEGTEKCSHCS